MLTGRFLFPFLHRPRLEETVFSGSTALVGGCVLDISALLQFLTGGFHRRNAVTADKTEQCGRIDADRFLAVTLVTVKQVEEQHGGFLAEIVVVAIAPKFLDKFVLVHNECFLWVIFIVPCGQVEHMTGLIYPSGKFQRGGDAGVVPVTAISFDSLLMTAP